MPRTGKCPNYSGCLLAHGSEYITLPDDLPFDCPECKLPLVETGPAGSRKPIAVPMFILGGISLLVIMASGAVYYQVLHYAKEQMPGQIGSSFEQAEVAVDHGELMPSRHMPLIATPSPSPGAPPAGR